MGFFNNATSTFLELPCICLFLYYMKVRCSIVFKDHNNKKRARTWRFFYIVQIFKDWYQSARITCCHSLFYKQELPSSLKWCLIGEILKDSNLSIKIGSLWEFRLCVYKPLGPKDLIGWSLPHWSTFQVFNSWVGSWPYTQT